MTHIDADTQLVATRLRAAIESEDMQAYGALLDQNVRWGPADETPEACHSRAEVLQRLATQRARGMRTQLLQVVPGGGTILVGFDVTWPVEGGYTRGQTRHQVLRVRDSQIVDIRGYGSRAEAAAAAGLAPPPERGLHVRQLVPVLNVSNLAESFAWFGKLGWTKKWDWSEADGPPSFGAVGSGEYEIFLSLTGQGGRGHGQGVWLSIWIDDVDAAHAICQREGIEILQPPRDEPFGLREMHIRHPDGHVFRMSQPSHEH
jgi:predicted enzyme related to lactoylglutathione lyase